MRLATTPEEKQQWMAQWRAAETALLEQKLQELMAMTDADALRISNMLLQLADGQFRSVERETYSGLVEQQRIFHGIKEAL
jgi:hypothetical protein